MGSSRDHHSRSQDEDDKVSAEAFLPSAWVDSLPQVLGFEAAWVDSLPQVLGFDAAAYTSRCLYTLPPSPRHLFLPPSPPNFALIAFTVSRFPRHTKTTTMDYFVSVHPCIIQPRAPRSALIRVVIPHPFVVYNSCSVIAAVLTIPISRTVVDGRCVS